MKIIVTIRTSVSPSAIGTNGDNGDMKSLDFCNLHVFPKNLLWFGLSESRIYRESL